LAHSVVVVRFVLAAVFLLAASAQAVRPCGPDALAYACGRLGVPYREDRVAGIFPSSGESSLLDLKRAAEALGLVARGVRMTADEAMTAPKPFLAHVDGDHFVTVTGADRLYVYVCDPAGDDAPWSLSFFRKRFTGAALLLALPRESKARLIVEPEAIDFGVVPRGERVAREFTVRNAGGTTLRILRVVSACDYVTTKLEKDVLERGESCKLSVEVDTSGRLGPTNVRIRVGSNDPGGERFLSLSGVVRAEFDWSPNQLDLGLLDPGQEGEVRVTFVGSGDAFSGLTEASSSEGWLTPSAERAEEDGQWTVRVHYRAPDGPGVHVGEVVVKTGSPGLAEVRIPVNCTVRGEIDVHPAGVFFGAASAGGDSESIEVTVTTQGGTEVTGVETTREEFTALLAAAGDGLWKVTVGFNPGDKPGIVKGELLVKTSSPAEPVLRVPLFALVR